MKAQRRHQLQVNTLLIEMTKAVEFLKRRSNYIAWGALGVAVVVFGVVFYFHRQSAKADERQAAFDRCLTDPTSSVEDLKSLATQTDDKRLAALSCVLLGDHCAAQALHARSPADRSAGAQEAAKWYRKVIDEFPKEALAVGKARFGLGKLAEGERNFLAAKGEYEEVLRTPALAGQPLLDQVHESYQNLMSGWLVPPVEMATTLPAAASETPTPPVEPSTSPATTKAVETKPATEPATKAVGKPAETGKAPATQPTRPSKDTASKPAPKKPKPTTQPAS